MDPASLAVGAAILVLGYLFGRVGRSRRASRTGSPSYVCGCRHHLSLHDPTTGACKASDYSVAQDRYRPCSCQQYIGERPLDLSLIEQQAQRARQAEGDS
ncbi:hypothetical protein [Actinophytocola sp.]|uniref:hypothetical protein n=1 Tax=Actinophytocola sp. TaxID=1872138 RepID=UPI002D8007BB|nr:hypothetical protein [Actinophytocola sp.]HET9144092.1 hypothetical protein [Actinophytocola sp.]